MTKAKMYCPETMGTFMMMFGFKQPLKYIIASRTKLKNEYEKRKKRNGQTKGEQMFNSKRKKLQNN